MVYITSWDDFVDRSVQLFRADPDSTRYVMKYRHCDGKLVLKVTDNKEVLIGFSLSWHVQILDLSLEYIRIGVFVLRGVVYGLECNFVRLENWIQSNASILMLVLFCQCLKFKTDQAQDVKKMEKLNNLFFTLMSRGPDADVSEVTGKEQTEARAGKKGRGRKQ
ncbi:hypothetical protein POTOM_019911 [Populus tomentosa]|uniref:SRP9 domain-containing protein n=1 Tax=Populus tomentosa TaxID=118781 RepID=A0A8X8D3H7_POPTO|nr:hypothetical protein POTOM_019911 [Populus tomentosa]